MNKFFILMPTIILLSVGGCTKIEVLGKNRKGISIVHNKEDRKEAFIIAEEHCDSINKFADYESSSYQSKQKVISTWHCNDY